MRVIVQLVGWTYDASHVSRESYSRASGNVGDNAAEPIVGSFDRIQQLPVGIALPFAVRPLSFAEGTETISRTIRKRPCLDV